MQKIKSYKHEKGQSLVEMAISLVMLLILVAGLVDISFALFNYVTMRDAAQEGALFGSIRPDSDQAIRDRTAAAASDVMVLDPSDPADGGNITVTIGDRCEGISGSDPNKVTVAIDFDYQLVFPFGNMFGGHIPLHAEVTDTILSPNCD